MLIEFLIIQAVDWWSLGALAHEMLMGKPPFRSKNAKELHTKILTAKVTDCHDTPGSMLGITTNAVVHALASIAEMAF